MVSTVFKISASGLFACAVCALGVFQAIPAVNANPADTMPNVVESVSAEPQADTQDIILPVLITTDEIIAPEEEIASEEMPLGTVEEVPVVEAQNTEQTAPAPVVDTAPATVATPAPAPIVETPQVTIPAQQQMEFVVGAAYMIDGDKLFFMDSYTYDGMRYYTFESEEVSGDGWGIGTAELIFSENELSRLNIQKI